METKFKVGDKVALVGTVRKKKNQYYPFAISGEDFDFSFTENGRYSTNTKEQDVFLLSELSPYPKWMKVWETENQSAIKRFVLCEINGSYFAVDGIDNEQELGTEVIRTEKLLIVKWSHAEDLPEIPDSSPDYKAKYEDLTAKFEKLEKAFNEIKGGK